MQTSFSGLQSSTIPALQQQYGRNELLTQNPNTWWKILLRQFTDVLVIILLVAGVLAFLLGETTDSIVIMGIVVLNGAIGFLQEYRTEKTLEALKQMVHPTIRVVRDGQEQLIDTTQIVPGDIVILSEGDKVPADGVLRESAQLRVSEAALTGESLPVGKDTEDSVFMGTSVVKGSGIMQVQATGMATQFGEIAALTTSTEQTPSPLQKELLTIGVFVAKVTLVLCVVLFFVGLWRYGWNLQGMVDSLLFSVSVAIAAVPEGLPTTITIALALGAGVLARKHAIMKRLSGVETLGAVSTICSDKTGTLTKNEMTVRSIMLSDGSLYQVSGVGYDPHIGDVTPLTDGARAHNALLEKLYAVADQCNDATLQEHQGQYMVLGDPTEGALLTLARKANHPAEPRAELRFPFDAERKMMSTVAGGTVRVKGSPDAVLERCMHYHDGNAVQPMTDAKRAEIQQHYRHMAENALRVLAFAEKSVTLSPSTEAEAESALVFLGLIGMIDPPRSEVRDAVAQCRYAGVRVIVITGDYGITARAIASELGIVYENNDLVLTGTDVDAMSDQQLQEILRERSKAVIIARALPAQKRRIVSLLQDLGEVVAMTGDGVNDAPALKKADIGVAMGITGTEVSKEAATMVLQDDSFASIVTAVGEGRRIYGNLKKCVWFIFSCNIGELITIFAAIIFQFPLPLTAVLILCVDLGTDILPAIALGTDTAEKNLMTHPPRDPKARMMRGGFVWSFALMGALIGLSVVAAYIYTLYGDAVFSAGETWRALTHTEHAQTVAFSALVMVQLLNVFSARSDTAPLTRRFWDNSFLLVSVLSSVLLVLLMLYLPWLNRILGTVPLGIQDWGVVGIASVVPILFREGWKQYRQFHQSFS
ncbi:cation-translocating P-type ATPase [Candidatus Peribacteria bacterium]|nr:cation-translocating P-type ATPase [Candidatus Peribacteria bacterium]